MVDGVVVEEPGFRIAEAQLLELSPKASLVPLAPVTILLHKPAGWSSAQALASIGAASQSGLDQSNLRILKRHSQGLSIPSELEDAASGLLILTQDWHVNRKLTEEARKIEHEIIVEVIGQIAPDGLARLNQGGPYAPALKVSWQNETRLRFALKGMQAGQIVKLCESVGLQVVTQKRIRIGRVPMAALAAGQWRYLAGYERL